MRDYIWGALLVMGLFAAGMILASILIYTYVKVNQVHAPQNIEELEQWSEGKIYDMRNTLKCDKLPYKDTPEDLLELKRICGISGQIWLRKRDEENLNKASEGLKFLPPKIGE